MNILRQRESKSRYTKNIISQLGFVGFRIISDINVDQLDEIISNVMEILGHSSESLSLEEKEKIFGPLFAKKPRYVQIPSRKKNKFENYS